MTLDYSSVGALAFTTILSTLAVLRQRGWRPNFVLAVTIAFAGFVLPKAFYFGLYGNEALISGNIISLNAFNAALVAISAFVSTIALVYLLFPRQKRPVPFVAGQQSELDPLARIVLLVGLFAATTLLLIFSWYTWKLSGHLFQKIMGVSRLSAWYWLQKLCEASKIGVYVVALYALRGVRFDKRMTVCVGALIVISLGVFAVSGQRAGIFIFVIQAAMFLAILGALHLRHIAISTAIFVPLSILIVALRTTTENSSFAVVNLLRRYFFEPEKIAGVISLVHVNQVYERSAWAFLVSLPTHPPFFGFLDRYLGRVGLGSDSAVPPSVLGEVIFYGGGIAIVPAAVALALGFLFLERRLAITNNNAIALILVTVLSCGYFMMLNSSIEAFALRCLMEITFLLLAVALVTVLDHITRSGIISQERPLRLQDDGGL